MVNFETVGTPKRISVNDTNFFEVKKTRVEGSEKVFITVSKGFVRKDGTERFTGGIGLPQEREKVEQIINAVLEMLEEL